MLGGFLQREQRRVGVRGTLRAARHDFHLKPPLRQVRENVLKSRHGHSGANHGEDHAADSLRQFAELEPAGLRTVFGEKLAGGAIDMMQLKTAADNHAGTAEAGEDLRHHAVVGLQLLMAPCIPQRQPYLLQEVEEDRQLVSGIGFAGESFVEDGYPEQRLPIQNGHGHLGSENLKLPCDFPAFLRFPARRAQDAAVPVEIAANAGAQRQREVLDHAFIHADGAGRAQPAVLRQHRAGGEQRRRLSKEDDRAIHAEDLAQQQEELPEQLR